MDSVIICQLPGFHFSLQHSQCKKERPSSMATLFDSLPSAGVKSTSRGSSSGANGSSTSGAIVTSGERTLQWVYDEETSNCMLCNTQFTLITRKVLTIP
jgi:hypothetical protein